MTRAEHRNFKRYGYRFFRLPVRLISLLAGLALPIPGGAATTVINLVGTTVVAYNLFLHAAVVKLRWSTATDLSAARVDTVISIDLGGLISILVSAASLLSCGRQVTGVNEMARQFEPLFGAISTYLLGVGLCAAGFSSAITAALVTAYAMSEIIGLEKMEPRGIFAGFH